MSILLPSQRTQFVRDDDIKKDWILIDAREQILGRLATRIAHRLRGKHKPQYAPHQNVGDYVIVVNAKELKVSGNKLDQKLYQTYTGYAGGLKTATLREKMEKDPIYALKKAVQRMLPKGRLGRQLIRQVHIYADANHPHQAQNPTVWQPTFR